MFYAVREDRVVPHGGLAQDPLRAIVAPRPIGWITTVSRSGVVNLAPYSYFNAVASRPPIVFFSSGSRKDSQLNAEETGEFVCNVATWELREQMNLTSADLHCSVSEPEAVGLVMAPSRIVAPPRVLASPAQLECVYLGTHRLVDSEGASVSYELVFGEVVGVHVDDRFIHDGRLDTAAMQPIGRLGYDEYAVVREMFPLRRPRDTFGLPGRDDE